MAIGSGNANASRTWLLLLGAIGFGVAAAILSVFYLKSREAALRAQMDVQEQRMAAVVVANRDLPKGTQLTPGIAAVREVPVEFVHGDAIVPDGFANFEGKVLVQPVQQGKPILSSFIDDEFPMDFSDTIEVGRRAMTITVDEINSQANMTRPGNHIDLYVNIPINVTGYPVPGQADGNLAQQAVQQLTGPQVRDVVMPILQDVRVLATGREGYADFQEQLLRGQLRNQMYTTLTLDVTPEQAAMLTAAQDNGDLLALLRNRKDRGGAKFAGITAADLYKNAQDMHQAAMMQASQRSADGLTVGPDGTIMTRDGIVLKDQNLVVGEDGVIRTRDGVDIAGLGLTVNENGELVTADGTVVSADDIITTADGVVMTKDGKILSSPGARMTEDGFIIAEDGTIMTKDGVVLEGARLNADGQVVAADGTVLKADDIVLNDDGSIATRKTHTDFRKNADGSVTLADGTVLQEGEYSMNADGSITTTESVAGMTGRRDASRAGTLQAALGVDADGTPADLDAMLRIIGYIRGGDSEAGVAKPGIMPVIPLKQDRPDMNALLQTFGEQASPEMLQ
ncbi:MAG: Flp pilus assembly protein CpaB [Gammaproteobacteria bacterium]